MQYGLAPAAPQAPGLRHEQRWHLVKFQDFEALEPNSELEPV